MESFLEGKTIFVTGATGFLAKILVEKILRLQPNTRKLFLLIRATDTKFAKKRFNDEVMQCELFSVLREKIGVNNLNSLIEEKVFPVAGDISFEDFGIKSSEMKDEMFKEIDIIINSAATTRFDERYDIAMNINVLGALNVLKFAKRCENVKIIVHVSTAYVCGEGEGVIPEKSFILGETLNKISKLDINEERKVIYERLKEVEAQNLTQKEVTLAMRNLGIQRANLHGWPNTYSFTKAMGEMLLGHYKENVQVIIIRPTIITSTYKEPFSGWIEGVKTVDSFILVYGKGATNFCFGDPNTKLDMILELANVLSWHYFDKTYKDLKRKIDMSIRLSELYKPYLFFHGSFDDVNTETLRMTIKEHKMDDVLNFDPTCINWEDYFMNTHLPGAVNHIF